MLVVHAEAGFGRWELMGGLWLLLPDRSDTDHSSDNPDLEDPARPRVATLAATAVFATVSCEITPAVMASTHRRAKVIRICASPHLHGLRRAVPERAHHPLRGPRQRPDHRRSLRRRLLHLAGEAIAARGRRRPRGFIRGRPQTV